MTIQPPVEPPLRAADVVAAAARDRVDYYLANPTDYNPTASLSSLSNQIEHEYGDRFLVELIQNAYDAQPSDAADGVVHIRFDETLDPPVLYVANSGEPFRRDNFTALTNLALSSKPAGEGIGNKGIGFRSVLHVCESPEVFSVDPDEPSPDTFNGYCFGFASDEAMRDLVASVEEFERVRRDFSRYLLPVPADASDPQLGPLRAQGMVTAVKLPMRNSAAAETTRRQLQVLLAPDPPIGLFLDRIATIVVEHVDGEGRLTESRATRYSEDVVAALADVHLQWVTVGAHRYLTASRHVSAGVMRGVIQQAIERQEIAAGWSTWNNDAVLTIAVAPEADEPLTPTMYTYLPMGVGAPFVGYLNAPFHTKLARLDVDEGSVFNGFLLTEAAHLASQAIIALRGGESGLPLRTRQSAIVDFLCWDDRHLHYLRDAMASMGEPLEDALVAPAEGGQGADWYRLGDIRRWDRSGYAVLSRRVIRAFNPILAESLSPARQMALCRVARSAFGVTLEPSDEEVAAWVEQAAATLKRTPAAWNRFLTEVATEFLEYRRDRTQLERRAFLLDDSGKLRRSGPWSTAAVISREPTVFLPPATSRATSKDADDVVDLRVPKRLSQALVYLNAGIPLLQRKGSSTVRTPVAELFRDTRLVEEYGLAAILEHTRRVLMKSGLPDETYRQALEWILRQDTASRSPIPDADLVSVGLRVPTRGGWRLAREAYFSAGWSTPRAAGLDAVVRAGAAVSPSLAEVREATLLDPGDWPRPLADAESVRRFLQRCGVRDGLHPVGLQPSSGALTTEGSAHVPARVARHFGIDDVRWLRAAEQQQRRADYPYTPYTGDAILWTLPGAEAFDTLTNAGKAALAAAIIETCGNWPSAVFRYRYERRSTPNHRRYPDPRDLPSPLRAFLTKAPWFPMSDPGRREQVHVYFVAPNEAWTFNESGDQQAPQFARLAPVRYRRLLSHHTPSQARLVELGLRVWGDRLQAVAQLAEIGLLVEKGLVSEGNVRRARRSLRELWGDVGRAEVPLPPDLRIVVEYGDKLGTVRADPDDACFVYVDDTRNPHVAAVLRARGEPVVVAGDGQAAADALARIVHLDVRRMSRMRAVVTVAGHLVPSGEEFGAPLREAMGPWFERFLLVAASLSRSRFAFSTDAALRDAVARYRSARVVLGSPIVLDVEGLGDSPGTRPTVLLLDEGLSPLIVVDDHAYEVGSWRAVAEAADELAALMRVPDLASDLRAAALQLERDIGAWRAPTTDDLARALHVTVGQVRGVIGEAERSVGEAASFLGPVVAALAGIDALEKFGDHPIESREDLLGALVDVVGPDAADGLLGHAESAESLDDLRRALGIALGDLNDVLRRLGMPRIEFADRHLDATRAYVNAHRSQILDALRRRFLDVYLSEGPLDDYVSARGLGAIVPDERWLHHREEPDESDLASLVDAWLEGHGRNLAQPHPLHDFDSVREANLRLVRTELPKVANLVETWCATSGHAFPALWTDPADVRSAIDASGRLDFTELSREEIPRLLSVCDLWPLGMPETLDPDLLGLAGADLGSTVGAAKRAARERERNTITFGERRYDVGSEELDDLLDAVDAALAPAFLATPAKISRLQVRPRQSTTGTPPTGSGGGGGSGSCGRTHPTQVVTEAIGLVGERLAYKWLLAHYPECNPSSWRSANRQRGVGGDAGDDSLGYDFEVARRAGRLYFEVKATMTDDTAFDIGTSELRFARQARGDTYRILFIRRALSDPELIVLPNPLDPRYEGQYEQMNQGVRLKFLTERSDARSVPSS